MKKVLQLIIPLCFSLINYSQFVNKTPFIEHFTGANCSTCPQHDDDLYLRLQNYGDGTEIKISYNSSWSWNLSGDPLASEYPSGPASRYSYYSVSGITNCSLNGGNPWLPWSTITSSSLNNIRSQTTPYLLNINQNWNNLPNTGLSLTVNVDITNLDSQTIDFCDRLYVVMVEDTISFQTAPGASGETNFYDVCRQFYDATNGNPLNSYSNNGIFLDSILSSATTTYSFTLDSFPSYIRDFSKINFICFVQNHSTKEIEQAARTNPAYIPSVNISSCGSYTYNGQIYTQSGTYLETTLNSFGIDSSYAFNLTIFQPSTNTITTTACNNYPSPSGNVYTSTGIYTDTIPNSVGCDSTITIDLTVNYSSSHTITQTACDTYTAPSGTIYTTNGIYNDTISNTVGCDSVITIDLTVNYSSTHSITQTVCGSYTLNGQTYTFQWNLYTNINQCRWM